MTEEHPRTGAARDVPPPRPVRAPAAAAEPDDSTPLGRAARAVADAVGGLLGTSGNGATPPRADDAPSGPAGLKDVLGAVAGAAAAWRERREAGAPPPTAPPPTAPPPTPAPKRGGARQRSPSAVLSRPPHARPSPARAAERGRRRAASPVGVPERPAGRRRAPAADPRRRPPAGGLPGGHGRGDRRRAGRSGRAVVRRRRGGHRRALGG